MEKREWRGERMLRETEGNGEINGDKKENGEERECRKETEGRGDRM